MAVTRAELCLCGLLCDKDFAVLGGGVRFFSAIKSCGDSRSTSSASLAFGTFPSRGRLLAAVLLSDVNFGFPLRGSWRR